MNFDSKLAQKFVYDAAWLCLGHMQDPVNLLGVEQVCVGVNKMDCDIAGYEQSRYVETANEMKSMLLKVGWKKDFVEIPARHLEAPDALVHRWYYG